MLEALDIANIFYTAILKIIKTVNLSNLPLSSATSL